MTRGWAIAKRWRRSLACVALSLPALCLATGAAFAAPGELDSSFGSGGKSLANFGGADFGWAVALQPDGRIVVAGSSDVNGTGDFAVARLLNPQGTFDTSFGGGTGRSLAHFGGNDSGSAVAFQPDGRIVVAGSSTANGSPDFAVARLLNPQGTFDTSFGGGTGRSLAGFGGVDVGEAVALQPDGRIVVAGWSSANGLPDFAVARLLNPQGDFDTSFGGGTGRSLGNFGAHDFGEAMALQPDGRIVVAGSSNASGTNDFAVARLLNPQGTFDGSFGGGTGRSLANFGGSDHGEAVALQPDGRIVVAGDSNVSGTTDFAVARLLAGGGLDNSFAGDGKSAVDFGGAAVAEEMVLQPDGKIIVAGRSGDNFVVARLQPNGLLDSTFGNAGKSVVDFGGSDRGEAVALQPDGRVVVAGSSDASGTFDFAVARLQNDPGGAVGGGGSGAPRCAGRRATIVGTTRADRLKGTRGRDVIVSRGGKDRIKAGRGADIVCTGTGNDRAGGGPGNDRMYGQSGKDRLAGDSGNDRLSGDSGNDRLLGGRGKDRLLGGRGRDRLLGGLGRDLLRGGPGKDRQRQ